MILVAGRGRLGRALHRALGPRAAITPGSRPSRAALQRASTLILAVPDPRLEAVAERVAPLLRTRAVVLHCAGSRGAGALGACRARGIATGVMHPLVSFASPRRAPGLEGTTFVVAGDGRAVAAARRIARWVGARAIAAEVHGAAYHAAAALSANGAAALALAAVRVLEREGIGRRDAERAIGALLRSVGENVARLGVPAALSGPVIRGDAETVRAHRAALRAVDRRALAAYDAVAPAILACAEEAGLTAKDARAVRRALRR